MENKKILNSKLLKNGIWLFLLQIFNTVIPLLTIPYITKVLGMEKYGIFSKTLNWIIYFQVIVEYGFGLTGARKVSIAKHEKDIQKTYNNILTSRILLTFIVFIIFNLIALLSKFSNQEYISALLLFIMIIGTSMQLTWLFQGKEDMKFISLINIIARTISIILILCFVKDEKDIYLYCFLYSITTFISSIISMFIAKRKYNFKFSLSTLQEVKEELKDGKDIFASSAMTKIFSNFGITVLGLFSTNYFIGIYSALIKIPYVLTMAFSPISQVLFPYNSKKINKNKQKNIKQIKNILLPIFTFFLIIVIILIIARKFVVKIVFGEKYIKYSIILIPLALQFLFAVLNNFIGVQYLVASGKTKEYSKAFFISCISLIIYNIVLGYFKGIYGVSIASLLGEITLTMALICQLRKEKI